MRGVLANNRSAMLVERRKRVHFFRHSVKVQGVLCYFIGREVLVFELERTPGRRLRTRARSRASRRQRRRITPDDCKLEVRVFLAALATGASVRGAAKLAALSKRRILRWVAFNGFLPAAQEAKRKGQIAKGDPFGQSAFEAGIELTLALQDRDLQQAAARYVSGD